MAHSSGLPKITSLGSRVAHSLGYNEILPRLYLGDISNATKKDEMSKLGITDMITVEIKPLPASELAASIQRYMYISVMDHPKQDILSHFEASNEFIEAALKNPQNKIYVHCVAGISRSASLVIAYVMKTRSMNYNEAFDLVFQKRRIVDPNEGFVRQLHLYHKMKYKIDIANIEYRRLVLDALIFEFRLVSLSYYQIQGSKSTGSNSAASSAIQVPLHIHKNLTNRDNVSVLFDQYYNKLHLQEVSKFPHVYDQAFRCNKCRAIIFYAISVIENKLDDPSNQVSTIDSGTGVTSCPRLTFDFKPGKDHGKICSFIFIEPQPWMSKSILERDGNIECYGCRRKLGKFDWSSGENCSCARHNSHININLFKIMRKKVDPAPIPNRQT